MCMGFILFRVLWGCIIQLSQAILANNIWELIMEVIYKLGKKLTGGEALVSNLSRLSLPGELSLN